jgi:hypothetical protein
MFIPSSAALFPQQLFTGWQRCLCTHDGHEQPDRKRFHDFCVRSGLGEVALFLVKGLVHGAITGYTYGEIALRTSQVRVFKVCIVSALPFTDLRQPNQIIEFIEFDHPVVEGCGGTSAKQFCGDVGGQLGICVGKHIRKNHRGARWMMAAQSGSWATGIIKISCASKYCLKRLVFFMIPWLLRGCSVSKLHAPAVNRRRGKRFDL